MIGNVVGNYRIERELGEGGMSHVYVGRTIARTEILPADYVVVLKVMSEELAGEVTARKRFVKEAHILAKLRHRYITRFYEFINNADHAVLVMEFVEGTPVDVLLTERGALPIADAISTAQCLLEALVYAHGKGIVHRDIKPANLIRENARRGEGDRLRHRQDQGRRRRQQPDRPHEVRLPPRHAALHVARADPRAEGCRREERRLLRPASCCTRC